MQSLEPLIISPELQTILDTNSPIEESLHVITVVSNPCQYRRRFVLAKEFIQRMESTSHVILYIVELAYGDQAFHVTEEGNPRHLQLRAEHPLWHKENMINLGTKLLPPDWKAFAWIDADVIFEDPEWALNTLKILNGYKDIVQLFSHMNDLDKDGSISSAWYSAAYNAVSNYKKGSHPGMGWACTRMVYEQMGGLYAYNILGGADFLMMKSFTGNINLCIDPSTSEDYKKSLLNYGTSAVNIRVGYVPGTVRHQYHGTRKNRQYEIRLKILADYAYSPSKHLTTNSQGVLVPTDECPRGFLEAIKAYFYSRDEDDIYRTE